MGAWIKGLPAKPGRYWFREPDGSCGLALVKWPPDYGFREYEAKLQERSALRMAGGIGKDSDPEHGWAFGNIGDVSATEFWSVAIEAPPGTPLPDLPLDPIRKTNDELDAIENREAKRIAEHEAQRKVDEVVAAKRKADLIAAGVPIYKCTDCDEIYSYDELGMTRRCSNCDEEFFVEPEGERNCTACNRPFTRLEESMVAPCCESVAELVPAV